LRLNIEIKVLATIYLKRCY